jgi:Na+-driven multidrug efflux pump
MTAKLKIRDTSGWTMFVFGVIALLLGLLGLLHPEILLSIFGFSVLEHVTRTTGDYTLVFVTASSMALFNIGAYYILAAVNDLKSFYNSAAVKAELDEV